MAKSILTIEDADNGVVKVHFDTNHLVENWDDPETIPPSIGVTARILLAVENVIRDVVSPPVNARHICVTNNDGVIFEESLG